MGIAVWTGSLISAGRPAPDWAAMSERVCTAQSVCTARSICTAGVNKLPTPPVWGIQQSEHRPRVYTVPQKEPMAHTTCPPFLWIVISTTQVSAPVLPGPCIPRLVGTCSIPSPSPTFVFLLFSSRLFILIACQSPVPRDSTASLYSPEL